MEIIINMAEIGIGITLMLGIPAFGIVALVKLLDYWDMP